MSGPKEVKIVVVGDGAVGKTCLLVSYTQNKFSENYVATVFDNYESLQHVDGVTYQLQLWDTAGQEEYDRLRALSFPDTDVFLICFAVTEQSALKNVEKKWFPEIKQHAPTAPIVLVGTKMDLRDDPPENAQLVTRDDALDVVKRLKLAKYVECSARTQKNITLVFETAVRVTLSKGSGSDESGGSCCTVL
ncbi:MAG: putative Cell division control protein 42 [Streblomastix strix]|uniref:Putative Cell division control protein 42 n=1 Tax=Streblomastix strix TaxID=222440 RepID=A0A5J4W5I5_9EUKA|nr:MAG: putative Cell division control protein 42 [Streblomastix strix]